MAFGELLLNDRDPHFLIEGTTSDLAITPWDPRLPETLAVGETFPEQNFTLILQPLCFSILYVDIPSNLLPVCLLQKTSHSPSKRKAAFPQLLVCININIYLYH